MLSSSTNPLGDIDMRRFDHPSRRPAGEFPDSDVGVPHPALESYPRRSRNDHRSRGCPASRSADASAKEMMCARYDSARERNAEKANSGRGRPQRLHYGKKEILASREAAR